MLEEATSPQYKASTVLIMVCIYIFLVIERPWESIRYLQGWPIERTFAIALIIVAFINDKFRIVNSPANKWVYGLLAIHFILAPFAFNTGDAVDQGIEYAKMVILYLLMLSVADNANSLKLLIKAYVFSTMFYVFHSINEFINGRHVWRMGISRMIGVDSTFNDPNAFGATIVLSLPFVFVLLKTEESKKIRMLYYAYLVLSVFCVVQTGSRTSFFVMSVLGIIFTIIHLKKHFFSTLVVAGILSTIIWSAMPEEKQNRIRTLWDPSAGPANAQASADGRMVGWEVSWRMFKQQPLTGVGAGGKNYVGYRVLHQVDDGPPSANQSHILYGEVIAEFGLLGAVLFMGLIFSIFRCCRLTLTYLNNIGEESIFLVHLAWAILATLLLLLIFGIGGHNFYRPMWLWLATWSGILFNMTKVQKFTMPKPSY